MPTRHGLPPAHLLLAVAIMAVWGTNFVVIKYALEHLPPLTLALLRFTLAFFPLAFFLPRPKVGWGNLAAYGVLIGAGQFGILFTAMRADITPGLASLVVQTQVFFTIFLSIRLTGEKVGAYQIVALLLASSQNAIATAVARRCRGRTRRGHRRRGMVKGRAMDAAPVDDWASWSWLALATVTELPAPDKHNGCARVINA